MFYDTHAHLDYPDYKEDLGLVIERARAAGIERVITIGIDRASSERAIALSERFPEVYAAVGWHPSHASEAPADVRAELRAWGRHPRVVAMGETGLDFYRLPSAESGGSPEQDEVCKARQREIFQQHMEVAAELGLNCIIHQREAFDETLGELERWTAKGVRGVFHCFVNGPADMERVLATGSLVSFTGIVTFKNAQTVRDTVSAVPWGKFMLETDSPYLAPVPYRGKRCEPAYVREIAQVIAGVKGCSVEELGERTTAAADEFFKFDRGARL